jgi:serine/threonine protein phosphatase PrpC
MDLPVTEASTTAGGDAAQAVTCPSCGAAIGPDWQFCEACGSDLPQTAATAGEATVEMAVAQPVVPDATPSTCPACGGTFAADGYCLTCGAKAPNPRDHFTEQPAPWVAGACDRGIRHTRNEDAMALAAGDGRAVLVVCDGVTTATDSDIASMAAARAARDVLDTSNAQGLGIASSRVSAVLARLAAAADAANDAVLDSTRPDAAGNPPSCTFVAAVVERDLIVAGNVGDSRAYWLPDAGEPVMLGRDDSFAADQIEAGVPREQAEHGPQAHAITRWLGADAPPHAPRATAVTPGGPGWLLLCSDGLWNYCSEAADIAALVRRTASESGGDPLATAEALVAFANDRGGQDNITAALARITETTTQEGAV